MMTNEQHDGCPVAGNHSHHGHVVPSPTGFGMIRLPSTLTFTGMSDERVTEVRAKYERAGYSCVLVDGVLEVTAEVGRAN